MSKQRKNGEGNDVTPIATSFTRALRSLSQPGILWHLVWPTLVSIAVWLVVAWQFGGALSAWLAGAMGNFSWFAGWFGDSGAASAASVTAGVLLVLLLLPLMYATAATIVAVFALPLILERVAARDYPTLEKRRGGSQTGSVINALVALAWYLAGLIVTLPLWLIPGMGIVLPVLLAGYLNYRGYSYDALAAHAGADELGAVLARERGGLFLAGVVAGLLAFVPVLNLITPACAGLAFIHYCLEALRRTRKAA